MVDRHPSANTVVSNRRPVTYLVSAVLLLNLLVVALVGTSLFQSRKQYETNAASKTWNLARTLDEYLTGSFAMVDAVLDSVAGSYQQQFAAPRFDAAALQRQINTGFSHLHLCENLYITNEEGNIIQGIGLPTGSSINVADRTYFQTLRDNPDMGLTISEPITGRISGKLVVILARRASKSDGSFAGVVFAPIAVEHFYEVFASLDVGSQGSVHLRDTDIGVIVTYPMSRTLEVGHKAISKELRSMLEKSPATGTYFSPTSYDGTPRMASYRKLANYPFYVIVAVAEREYLQPWFDQAMQFAVLMALFFLSTIGLSWLAYRKWQRQMAATLELDQHRYHLEELVSERTLEANQAREAAEAANRAKSVFLANMSHELRTPLNAILGFSEMLELDRSLTAEAKSKLTTINRAGAHLLSMINDVLDLAKIEAGKLALVAEPTDLPALIEDLGRMFEIRARAAGLRFHWELAPDTVRHVMVDAGKLRQTLINLLGNALKFTKEGGFAFRAGTEAAAGDEGRLLLRLEVQDSGPGIAPDLQQLIFKPFEQVGHPLTGGQKGTGLGLTICRALVELMGGRIGVVSEPGKGALFWVDLPVLPAAATKTPATESPKYEVIGLAPNQDICRVLVTEDDDQNRLLLVNLLQSIGFDVREAMDGEQAIAQFQAWQPHFIWMDMRMPMLDGYEATRRIRALSGGDKVKIVAITASVFREQHGQILQAGCDHVVCKPYRRQEILETMQQLLGLRYRYRSEQPTLAEAPPLSETELKAALAGLDTVLRDELIEAAQRGDLERFKTGLGELAVDQANFADFLGRLADDYRFDVILGFLERTTGG